MVTSYNYPPHHDNLGLDDPITPSADDSISPSDGYFQQRSAVPQDVLIPDPTTNLETEESQSKGKEKDREREIEREQYAGYSPMPARSYTPYTPTTSTSTGSRDVSMGRRYRDEDPVLESSTLLDESMPPPAYEAATAAERSPLLPSPARSNADAPPDPDRMEAGFNALEVGPTDIFRRNGREPESMRGTGRPPFCGRRSEGCAQKTRRFCCSRLNRNLIRRALLILLLISVGIGIICAISGGHDRNHEKVCPGAHHTKSQSFEFDPKSFTFERISTENSAPHTGGQVSIVQGDPKTQKSAIKVELHLTSSDKDLLSSGSLLLRTSDSLTINSTASNDIPKHSHWTSRLNPCLEITSTISILPGTKLNDFALLVPSLSLDIANDVSLTVRNTTTVKCATSSVVFPPNFITNTRAVYHSRSTHIHHTSNSISGSYHLLDLLDLSTTSGSISITVIPEDASPDAPKPATIVASTRSGAVNIRFPQYPGVRVPRREYITRVSTSSGHISGHIFHGTETSLSSNSGGISVSLLPVPAKNATSSVLRTSAASGSTHLRMEPPLTGNLTGLNSNHDSRGSGAIYVDYPADWEGTAVAHSSGSGSVSISGRGVDVIREDRGRRVGVKGDKKASDVDLFSQGSGRVRFTVGY